MNPFLSVAERAATGPGSLVEAVDIRPGMRVLEVGGGSGQVATILATHWDVTVVALEPWGGAHSIQARADRSGVGQRVLAVKLKAQELGIFADGTFDAVISIGSFEMIGDERPQALGQLVRVAKPGAWVGIAEPMCLPDPIRFCCGGVGTYTNAPPRLRKRGGSWRACGVGTRRRGGTGTPA